MKVVVTGATGKQGRGALWYLLRQKDVSQIVVSARSADKLKQLVAELGDDRLVAKPTDLSDIEGAAKVFMGADVVLNCAYEGYSTDDHYVDLELPTLKAALKAGVNYISVGGKAPEPEELALSDEFERKGLLAILEMGELTGLIQVMVADAINRLDKVNSVDMKYGSRDLVPPEEHSRPLAWGPKVGERGKTNLAYAGLGATRFRWGADSVSYENGKLHYHPPRANPEVFEFREPIGAVTTAQSPGPAVISLSRSFPNIKHISLKTGGDPDFDTKVSFLRDLGLFANEPISVQRDIVWPWEVLMTLLEQLPPEAKPADIRSEARVIVRGEEAGKEVEYTLSWLRISPSKSKERVPASGLCAAIAAVILGRGQIKGKGVLMPEVCIPPEQYLDEFRKSGEDIEISRKVRL